MSRSSSRLPTRKQTPSIRSMIVRAAYPICNLPDRLSCTLHGPSTALWAIYKGEDLSLSNGLIENRCRKRIFAATRHLAAVHKCNSAISRNVSRASLFLPSLQRRRAAVDYLIFALFSGTASRTSGHINLGKTSVTDLGIQRVRHHSYTSSASRTAPPLIRSTWPQRPEATNQSHQTPAHLGAEKKATHLFSTLRLLQPTRLLIRQHLNPRTRSRQCIRITTHESRGAL